MKFRHLALWLGLALGAPQAAGACDVVHELAFNIERGPYEVLMNGVYVMGGSDGGTGGRPLMPFEFMKEGENEVTVRLLAADARADFSIMSGCRGSFDREGPHDEASLSGESAAVLRFTPDYPIDAEYLRAEAAGPDGLMDAVKGLQAAAEAGDVETVMAYHAPMLVEAQKLGVPVEQLAGMLGWFFEKGEKTTPSDLRIEEVMGGKVFVVTTAERTPPVRVVVKEDGGTSTWQSGAYWAKIDGKWGVLTTF